MANRDQNRGTDSICAEIYGKGQPARHPRKYGLGTGSALAGLELSPSEAKDPEPILQHYLSYRRLAEAMNIKCIDQMLQAGCILDGARYHRTVKVRPESHSILTQTINQKGKVMHDRLKRRVLV